MCQSRLIKALKCKIPKDPAKSMRKIVIELEVDNKIIRNAVKYDLRLKSYTRTPKHLLTTAMKEKRLEWCKKIITWFKKKSSTVTIVSDEKIFTVDVLNRRNDRFIAKSTAEVKGTFKTKHPAQVMVFGVVASDGKKMPIKFYKADEKINVNTSYKTLRYQVLPWLKANYPDGNYVWTQDGAPAHTARKIQDFRKSNFSKFLESCFWLPSSPDLNPLDYAIWGVLEHATNRTLHSNVDSLKDTIKEEWEKLSPEYLRNTCASFRKCVKAAIEKEGGHME
ncbi:uncharacterized protein LOC106876512 [Octopus bimaculoides]|uniref:uncharacterized protein LOC106876512 n=1 Tax=Octopus bimaculoides TaxID=37653 RepID=UPI00071D3895|nr:uncharacterized protein LOC106876512 [Octopus bimaculoides]|eukprot:XP_014780575.1 PREDICTED: uncharacterized protein LOC106876512 [Octopus bimaculoides]